MSYLRSLKTPAYSNWLMLGPDGQQMCRCAKKRVNWYLSRGLAEIVSDNPPTIKLNFTPQGPGNNDAFGLAPKQNRCVVCSIEENLTKHHIVPIMYRQFFPVEVKSRSSHDVVVICTDCHDEYEVEAMKLKHSMSVEFTGKLIEVVKPSFDAVLNFKIAGLAKVLLKHGEAIPPARRSEMISEIATYLGRVPTEEDFVSLNKISKYSILTSDPGKLIAEKVIADGALESFVQRWRQHFIDVAEPKFMPEHWSVTRKLVRD